MYSVVICTQDGSASSSRAHLLHFRADIQKLVRSDLMPWKRNPLTHLNAKVGCHCFHFNCTEDVVSCLFSRNKNITTCFMDKYTHLTEYFSFRNYFTVTNNIYVPCYTAFFTIKTYKYIGRIKDFIFMVEKFTWMILILNYFIFKSYITDILNWIKSEF